MLHSGQVRHDLVRLIREYYRGFPPKFPQICLKNNLQPLKIELPKSPLLETEQKSCVDLTPLLFSFIPNPSSTPLDIQTRSQSPLPFSPENGPRLQLVLSAGQVPTQNLGGNKIHMLQGKGSKV